MTKATPNKIALLAGCGGAALALGMTALPREAAAQAFQATPTLVQGNATFDRNIPNQDTITVVGLDAVVDWQPIENSGIAEIFLPSGNTGIFQGQPGDPIFGVINRILPDANGSIVQMNGSVISQLQIAGGGTAPGGFVMFYSPTGLLIGGTATFDVGGLLLSSLDPDIASFSQFVTGGGSIDLAASPGSAAEIIIEPGAQIIGSGEGSAFVAAGPRIVMQGMADINGSTAYIAAEDISLSYANGLFDIIVNAGTTVAQGILHEGTTTGPASTGTGDNHVIYGVAHANGNPTNMVFSGNLGFTPAATATVQNGDIILSANYNVSGTRLGGGDPVAGDIDFEQGNEGGNGSRADILLQDITATSRFTAAGSHAVQVFQNSGTSSFATDTILVGRELVDMFAFLGGDISVGGDLTMSARAGGPGLNDGSLAQAGLVVVEAQSGGSITVAGDTSLEAIASINTNVQTGVAGAAIGGDIDIIADGGVIDLNGDLSAIADATIRESGFTQSSGGDATGGSILTLSDTGGTIDVAGNVNASSSGFALQLTGPDDGGIAGDGIGGSVDFRADGLGSQIIVGGLLNAQALGVGSTANLAMAGDGTGGTANLVAINAGDIQIAQVLNLLTDGSGGTSSTGAGGAGSGGTSELIAQSDGTVTAGPSVNLIALGNGGAGSTDGGDGAGGSAAITADSGNLTLGSTLALADAFGGAAGTGNSGQGIGGQTAFLATGGSTLSLGGLQLFSNANGGTGATAQGGDAAAGTVDFVAEGALTNVTIGNAMRMVMRSAGTGGVSNGGSGIGGAASGGAVSFSVTDGATVNLPTVLGDNSVIPFIGTGAFGGGSSVSGGAGGNATAGFTTLLLDSGGTVVAGSILTGDNVAGGSSLNVNGDIEGGDALPGFVDAEPVGWSLQILDGSVWDSGIVAFEDFIGGSATGAGAGGAATAGSLNVLVDNALFDTFGDSRMTSNAVGGSGGQTGGSALARDVSIVGVAGGNIDFGDDSALTLRSNALGGSGTSAGGDAESGSSFVELNNATVNGNDLSLESRATSGADSQGGNAGEASADGAYVDLISGTTMAVDNLSIINIGSAGTGGLSQGGDASLTLEGGSSLTVDQELILEASAIGAGAGVAGDVDIELSSSNISTDSFTAIAMGLVDAEESSSINVSNGQFQILSSGTIDVAQDLFLQTENNGLILGGIDPDNLTATFDFRADGTIVIAGDNDNLPTFGSAAMTLTSSDIDIQPGARFGAIDLSFVSLDTENTAVIGGDVETPGYSVTRAEAERIEGVSISFFGPALNSDATGPDVEIRDLIIEGTQGDSDAAFVRLESAGSMRVTGQIEYVAAAAENRLELRAAETLEIIIPQGGITMTDANDELSGSLTLRAQSIVSAVSDLAAQISDDPDIAGLAEALGTNDGSLDQGGYVRAGGVALLAGQNIYVQNTGTANTPGGITVGDQGLIIGQISSSTSPTTGGTVFTFSGMLMEANDVLFFDFSVDESSLITLRTYSYAGGTAGDGTVVPAGGFDPILSLFDAVTGTRIGQNDDGGSNVPADPQTGLRYDTFFQEMVSPGEYTVAVSAFSNFAGATLEDPFDGGGSLGSRTADFFFEIQGASSASGPGGATQPLDVIAFGLRFDGESATTGEAFYNEVDFGPQETLSGRFTELSTFNFCSIVAGCNGVLPPTSGPLETAPPITNATLVTPPPVIASPEPAAQSETQAAFGSEFPSLFNSPEISEQGLVTDPVTSGGDSAVYAWDGADEDEDEDEDEDDEDDGTNSEDQDDA